MYEFTYNLFFKVIFGVLIAIFSGLAFYYYSLRKQKEVTLQVVLFLSLAGLSCLAFIMLVQIL